MEYSQKSTGSPSQKKQRKSSSSNSSDLSLNASIDRNRATKRPRRESINNAAEVRRLSDSLADKLDLLQTNSKLLVDNLNKLDLLQLQNSRPSVITSTPPVSPNRQAVEFVLPPESPSGSQVSSLNGSLFEENDLQDF